VTGPAAPPLPAELDALLSRMRLPNLHKAAPDVPATARAQRWEPAEVLAEWDLSTREGYEGYIRRTIKPALGHQQGLTPPNLPPGNASSRPGHERGTPDSRLRRPVAAHAEDPRPGPHPSQCRTALTRPLSRLTTRRAASWRLREKT
jgi:hypothetical protein